MKSHRIVAASVVTLAVVSALAPAFAQCRLPLMTHNIGECGLHRSEIGKFSAILPQTARFYIKRGNEKAKAHDSAGAVQDFSEAIRINPTVSRPNASDNDYFFDGMDLSHLLAEYNQIVRDQPNNAAAWAIRGEINYYLDNSHDGAIDFQKALALDPTMLLARYGAAEQDIFTHDPCCSDLSAGSCELALLTYPNDARLHLDKGNLAFSRNAPSVAKAEFEKAIAISPNWSRPYYMLARAHNELGQRDLALESLNKALKLDADLRIALQLRASMNKDMKNYAAAIADIDRLLTLEPDRRDWLYRERGSVKWSAGDYIGSVFDLAQSRDVRIAVGSLLTLMLLITSWTSTTILISGFEALRRKLLFHE